MKKIKTTDITVSSAMPLKKGSLDHLQAAYTESIQDVIISNQASGLGIVGGIMYGCKLTMSGLNFSITDGAVYFNGEVYRCDAVNGTLTGTNVIVGVLTTTYLTATDADPVEFSDSTTNNVHEIRKIVWTNAASLSGLIDYNTAENYRFGKSIAVPYVVANSLMIAQTGDWTIANAADWDYKWTAINGSCIMLDFNIQNSTITNTTNYVALSLPQSFNSYFSYHGIAAFSINAGDYIANLRVGMNDNKIFIDKLDYSTWAPETATFSIRGQIMLTVKSLF